MNQVFRWSPAVRTKDNGDKFGVFQCKCPGTTPGAKRHQGKNDMLEWDYYAIDASKVSGRVVWVDKTFSEFNNKTITSLMVALQTPSGDIDIVQMPFDGFNLRNVMNNICGIGDKIATDTITMTYGVWKKKDKDKKPVFNAKGEQIWSKTLNFEGTTPIYSMSPDVEKNYWQFREDNGLEPVKTRNKKGEEEFDDSAEMEFWDRGLVATIRRLMKSGVAIPFSYNSWICGQAVNPTGGGNLTQEEQELVSAAYEAKVKGKFEYFGSAGGNQTSAEDVRAALRNPTTGNFVAEMPTDNPLVHVVKVPKQDIPQRQASAPALDPNFPTQDVTPYPEDSDLPF